MQAQVNRIVRLGYRPRRGWLNSLASDRLDRVDQIARTYKRNMYNYNRRHGGRTYMGYPELNTQVPQDVYRGMKYAYGTAH